MRRHCYAVLLSAFLVFLPVRSDALIVTLLNFQANAIGVFQTVNSNSFSGQVAWTPFVNLGIIGFRGDVGVTFLKNGLRNLFLVSNADALISLTLFPGLSLEGGPGLHTWTDGNGGTNPAATGNIVIRMPGGPIDRIFAGYTRMFLGDGVNEIRAGVGFKL